MKYPIVDGKIGKDVKFEREKYSCSCLISNFQHWDNSKKCEERDRLKHGTEGYRKYFL